ncbi:MAG: hypothetical protein ACYTHM_12840, partial [Planctomycetota bacterium]
LGREDLQKKLEVFKKGGKKWTPAPKTKDPGEKPVADPEKKAAEDAYALAQRRAEKKAFQPAETILETKVIPLFEKHKDDAGSMKAYLLMAKVKEGLGKTHEILDWLEKSQALAEKRGDEAFKKACEDYLKDLKTRKVNLARTPFSNPENLGPMETISLKPASGQTRASRPLPQAFDNPYFWRLVVLRRGKDAEGKRTDVVNLDFPDPTFLIWTPKEREVQIATDGDGKGGRPFTYGKNDPKTEKLLLHCFDHEKGKQLRKPYELLVVENSKVSIAGNIRRFDPKAHPDYLGLRLRANTYRLGRLGGKSLLIVDENTNARFNDRGTEETGKLKYDLKYSGCDSIVVGTGPSSATSLYGSLIAVREKFFFIEKDDPGGLSLRIRPYKGPMGNVVVKFKGPRNVVLLHAVIGTRTGQKSFGFINVGRKKGAVAVPTGSYFFKWGLLCDSRDPSKGNRVEIWKGKVPDFTVEEGKTAELLFGGPFNIEMPVAVTGHVAELKTYEMTFSGKAGEVYRRFWNKPFLAEFKVLDAAGVTVKTGSLQMFTEQDALTPSDRGVELLEFAKHVKFRIDHVGTKPPLKAEFFVKHHPLLGRIQTPGWK